MYFEINNKKHNNLICYLAPSIGPINITHFPKTLRFKHKLMIKFWLHYFERKFENKETKTVCIESNSFKMPLKAS